MWYDDDLEFESYSEYSEPEYDYEPDFDDPEYSSYSYSDNAEEYVERYYRNLENKVYDDCSEDDFDDCSEDDFEEDLHIIKNCMTPIISFDKDTGKVVWTVKKFDPPPMSDLTKTGVGWVGLNTPSSERILSSINLYDLYEDCADMFFKYECSGNCKKCYIQKIIVFITSRI